TAGKSERGRSRIHDATPDPSGINRPNRIIADHTSLQRGQSRRSAIQKVRSTRRSRGFRFVWEYGQLLAEGKLHDRLLATASEEGESRAEQRCHQRQESFHCMEILRD